MTENINKEAQSTKKPNAKELLEQNQALQEELAKAQVEKANAETEAISFKDNWYRTAAEFENFKKSKTMRSLIIACNDVEEDCDKLYLATMHNLTRNSTDVLTTMSWYKIFDCLEACADACEHVSECVGSIIMKNT